MRQLPASDRTAPIIPAMKEPATSAAASQNSIARARRFHLGSSVIEEGSREEARRFGRRRFAAEPGNVGAFDGEPVGGIFRDQFHRILGSRT